MSSYLLWTAVAAVLFFLVLQSEYGLTFLYLVSERIRQLWSGLIYFVVNCPELPWVKYRIYRRNEKNARELAKQLGLDRNKDWNK